MMRPVRMISRLGLAASLAAGLFACAEIEAPADQPALVGFSTDRIVVGQTFALYGHQLVPAGTTQVQLLFTGQYLTDDGRTVPVELTVPSLIDGQLEHEEGLLDVLRVQRFGPFGVPFDPEGRPGLFEGSVTVLSADGQGASRIIASGQKMRLEVGPSVLIEQLEPLDASCGAPALRGFSSIPYVMTVRPVGIKAQRFVYTISGVNGNPGLSVFEHVYDTPVASDTLGIDELVAFDAIPDDTQAVVSVIRVEAFQADGQGVETALPFSIHRPVEIIYDGKREVAERYEPVPVSGCIPGSVNSRVSYSESRTEMRLRQVSVTLSQSTSQSYGVGTTESLSEGFSVGETQSHSSSQATSEREQSEERYGVSYSESASNDTNVSSSDGESWSWNMRQSESESEYERRMEELYGSASGSVSVGAEASGSIPGFAKVSGSVKTTTGVRAGGSQGASQGSTHSNSSSEGYSTSGYQSSSTSYGSATTEGRGSSFDSGYAVSRGTDRSVSDSQSLQNSRTWNLNQGASVDEVVQEGQSAAETLALVTSESESVLTSYSGTIPRNAYGIFYRQTTRLVRRAQLRTFDLCGLATQAGELQFNEWTWAPDLAIAPTCDTQLPPPNLPKATCFIPPCGG